VTFWEKKQKIEGITGVYLVFKLLANEAGIKGKWAQRGMSLSIVSQPRIPVDQDDQVIL